MEEVYLYKYIHVLYFMKFNIILNFLVYIYDAYIYFGGYNFLVLALRLSYGVAFRGVLFVQVE
jgi:hypothetical protein